MTRRVCICCSRALTERAKEHVVPLWLQRHLQSRKELLRQYSAIEGEADELVSTFSTDSLVEGRFCKDCNGGWMSNLEDQTKPTLIGLIGETREIPTLTYGERLTVSRWALKTAVVLTHSVKDAPRMDLGHLCFIRDHPLGMPPTSAVFAGRLTAAVRTWGYFIEPHGTRLALPDAKSTNAAVGIKVALSFETLTILVVGLVPGLRYCFETIEGVHNPIWPIDGPYLPRRGNLRCGPRADVEEILGRYAHGLSIRYLISSGEGTVT